MAHIYYVPTIYYFISTSWSCHSPDKGLIFDYFTIPLMSLISAKVTATLLQESLVGYFLEVVLLEISPSLFLLRIFWKLEFHENFINTH